MPWWAWLAIAAGAALVLIVAALLFRRRRGGGGGGGGGGGDTNVEAAAGKTKSLQDKLVQGAADKGELEELEEEVRVEVALGFEGGGLVQVVDDAEKKKISISRSDDGDESEGFNGLNIGKLGQGASSPPSIGLGTIFFDPDAQHLRPDPLKPMIKKLPSPPNVGNGNSLLATNNQHHTEERIAEAQPDAHGRQLEARPDGADHGRWQDGSWSSPGTTDKMEETPSATPNALITGYTQTAVSR
eukprot:759842-Hanusia_phi.AAC.2